MYIKGLMSPYGGFHEYLVVLITVLLFSTLLFSEQLSKKISKRESEL